MTRGSRATQKVTPFPKEIQARSLLPMRGAASGLTALPTTGKNQAGGGKDQDCDRHGGHESHADGVAQFRLRRFRVTQPCGRVRRGDDEEHPQRRPEQDLTGPARQAEQERRGARPMTVRRCP